VPSAAELTGSWWPVATEASLTESGGWLPVRLHGEPWLLARLDGQLVAVRDECPHRRVPLSAGRRVDTTAGQQVECRYHGWRFGPSGDCGAIPALGPEAVVPRGMRVRTAEVIARDGLLWLAAAQPA
jgi:vanillate O-demethylase monooxygenase subunit